jgi:two-component sensor histidine kinase
VNLLYSQLPVSLVASVMNVALVTLVLWSVVAHSLLLIWAVAMAVMLLARSLLVRRYFRAAPDSARIRPWRIRFILGAAVGGCGWGAAAVFLFPQGSPVHQVFIAFVLGGMAVGAAATMSPLLEAYWVFLFPVATPIILQMFLQGDTMTAAMGLMLFACTVVFINSARQVHSSITESIRLRFENLDLVQNLSAAKEQTEAANRALQSEIAERKRAEDRISASLQEKEVLLKEIHHRVKNNLQVISSLLNLQSRSIAHPEALTAFKDSQNRVRSMALIHEKLYQSGDLARIDFAAYIRELTSYLFRVYQSDAAAIQLRINVKDVFLSIETAVPCGLIISELVSNALKYAFPTSKKGEIVIELRPGPRGAYVLEVRDNGVGFAPDVDFRHTSSLGLRIVNILTSQLEGTIELQNNDGAAFTLILPLEVRNEEEEHGAGTDLSR